MGYEEEFAKFLLTLISDVDKRIKRGEQRLVVNNLPNPVSVISANFGCLCLVLFSLHLLVVYIAYFHFYYL